MPKQPLCLLLCWVLLAQGALADQNDPRLDELFQRLKNTDSVFEGAALEQEIWNIWLQHENPEYQNLMLAGIAQMNLNQPTAAIATFTRLIELAPDWAEAWNKRATIHYLVGNYAESEADIAETLKREPFHFGAISGHGLVLMGQRRYLEAMKHFQTLLEIYPAMPGVREQVRQLEELLRGTTI